MSPYKLCKHGKWDSCAHCAELARVRRDMEDCAYQRTLLTSERDALRAENQRLADRICALEGHPGAHAAWPVCTYQRERDALRAELERFTRMVSEGSVELAAQVAHTLAARRDADALRQEMERAKASAVWQRNARLRVRCSDEAGIYECAHDKPCEMCVLRALVAELEAALRPYLVGGCGRCDTESGDVSIDCHTYADADEPCTCPCHAARAALGTERT